MLGCSDRTAEEPGARFQVVDSAGTRLVTSVGPAWSRGEEWTVDTVPEVTIGTVDGDEAYVFSGILGVVSVDDNIVVATAGGMAAPSGTARMLGGADQSIRYFDQKGDFRTAVGGRGAGPQEFTRLRTIFSAGGQIWGVQGPGQPIKVFTGDGSFVGSVDTKGVPGLVRGVMDDGTLVAMDGALRNPAPGTMVVDTASILAVGPSLSIDTLLRAPSAVRLGLDRRTIPQPFRPMLLVATAGDGLYTTWSGEPQIVRYSRGAPDLVIRWSARRVRVTEQDRRTSAVSSPALEEELFPEFHPVMTWLAVDGGGNLWTQRPRETWSEQGEDPGQSVPEWDVFDRDGIWLGTVRLPRGFTLHWIERDRIIGTWKDEFDVEYVRVHAIRK